MQTRFSIPVLTILIGAFLRLACPASAEEGLILTGPEGTVWIESRTAIEEAGGRVLFAFPPGGIVADGEASFWKSIARLRPDWSIRFDALADPAITEKLGDFKKKMADQE